MQGLTGSSHQPMRLGLPFPEPRGLAPCPTHGGGVCRLWAEGIGKSETRGEILDFPPCTHKAWGGAGGFGKDGRPSTPPPPYLMAWIHWSRSSALEAEIR